MDAVISQRELRNDSGAIMRRVEQGESFTVARNGTPIADLVPHVADRDRRPRFVAVSEIAAGFEQLPDWGVDTFAREQSDLDAAVDDVDVDVWRSG